MSPAQGPATYVYCLLESRRPPRLRPAPEGMPDTGLVRALAVKPELWLIAADAPLARYGAATIERGLRDLDWVSACALSHEAVVEQLARQGTVIPMKLFTLFSSDDRAVDHVRRRQRTLDRTLSRIAGRQEWGLRVALDPARPRARAKRPAAAQGAGAGRRFLLGKKREQDARRSAAAGSTAPIRAAFSEIRRHADASRQQRVLPGAPVLLDAAFLVHRDRAARFHDAIRTITARLGRQGYTVTLTGPWPAYNFVGARS